DSETNPIIGLSVSSWAFVRYLRNESLPRNRKTNPTVSPKQPVYQSGYVKRLDSETNSCLYAAFRQVFYPYFLVQPYQKLLLCNV
ncbi:MAG: hypothetical protein LUH00_07720, partial [Lachnospiraceae bacterium]|nr:hypothetical protein [Lachnospiraceae bacterium]